MIRETFTDGYIECALWADAPEESGGELCPACRLTMARDCNSFINITGEHITEENATQAGHDFWLTRNGHGAGFWDGDWPEPAASALDNASQVFGPASLYTGDDGLIHIMKG